MQNSEMMLRGEMAKKMMKSAKMGKKMKGSFTGTITRMENREELNSIMDGSKKGKKEQYCCIDMEIDHVEMGDK